MDRRKKKLQKLKWKVRRRETYTIWYVRFGKNFAIRWCSDIPTKSARNPELIYTYVRWGRHSAGSESPRFGSHAEMLFKLSKQGLSHLIQGKDRI